MKQGCALPAGVHAHGAVIVFRSGAVVLTSVGIGLITDAS
jgi:hypothetical protein